MFWIAPADSSKTPSVKAQKWLLTAGWEDRVAEIGLWYRPRPAHFVVVLPWVQLLKRRTTQPSLGHSAVSKTVICWKPYGSKEEKRSSSKWHNLYASQLPTCVACIFFPSYSESNSSSGMCNDEDAHGQHNMQLFVDGPKEDMWQKVSDSVTYFDCSESD